MSGIRRAFSDAFVFGRSAGVKAHCKVEKRLAECLPAADWPVFDDNGDLKAFNGWHVFGSETARNHFIKHALILLSDNGKNDLCNLHFDNFFARSYDKTGVIWYTASIVVTAPGDYRIRRSVVATRAGMTKTAAFQLLMLDVETKFDAVLRGRGVNSGHLSANQNKRKGSSSPVSIISTPSEAMAPPKHETDDYNTWSGAPLTASSESKSSTPFSHSCKSSQGTQKSFASSQYTQASQSSQSTAPSVHVASAPSKIAYQPSLASLTGAKSTQKHIHHERHVSTPLQPTKTATSPTPKAAKHVSQPLEPRSATAPPQTIIKALPAIPRSSTEKLPLPSELEKIHPALRGKSHSTEGLKPAPQSKEPSIAGSSVYSRSPISPTDDMAKRPQVQPLHVAPDNDTPSPLHFEKPIAQIPARLLRQQMAFEIYV